MRRAKVAGAPSSDDLLICDLPHDHPEFLSLVGEEPGMKKQTRKTLNLIIHVRDANPHKVEHNHFVTSTLAAVRAAVMDAKMERHGHTPLPQPQQRQRPQQQPSQQKTSPPQPPHPKLPQPSQPQPSHPQDYKTTHTRADTKNEDYHVERTKYGIKELLYD